MKTFKKLPLALAIINTALLVIALAAICCSTDDSQPAKWEDGKTYEMVLLHTNDHHGTILPNDGRGGLAERATFIKSVRMANPSVLMVDAGDINTGTAFSNMFAAEPDILAYNLMGYDAATFGNHEFDGTLEKLENQIALAKFPFVSSNIKTANGEFLGGHQYLVKDYEGFRMGIIGITTLRTKVITGAASTSSLTFIPEIDAAKAAVALLKDKEKANIVIALTHIGDVKEYSDHVTSLELAEAVSGIDIIVDGHSHSKFETPIKVGNTWVVSSNEWGKYVGKGKLSVINGELAGFDWELVEINNKDQQTFAPDAEITALIAPFKEKADASLNDVIGEAADTFIFLNANDLRLTRYLETALGNMICNSNVWYFNNVFNQNIDFAFHNGGSMRAELPKGSLTREQVLTVMPYENYLYIVSLTGRELVELFDFIATIAQGAGAFPQFSSEVGYILDVSSKTIRDLTIGGAPVDLNKTYRFCTNDFLIAGSDGYTVLTKAQNSFNTSLLLSYVVIEYIKSQGIITPATDGRIQIIGGVIP
jgi:5'-nucleotidase/UDP-sugar diphosphatase